MTRLLPLAGLLFLLAACGLPRTDVRKDWSRSIEDLGVLPIYPMQSGISVGDVWVTRGPAALSDQPTRPFATLPVHAGTPREVALPGVTLKAEDAATLGLGALLASLGLSGGKNDSLTLDLTGATSQQIGDAAAWSALAAACQPGGFLQMRQSSFDATARGIGAYQAGRPAFLTLITTVYSATGIDYEVTDDSKLAAGEAAGESAPSAPESAGTGSAATGAESAAASAFASASASAGTTGATRPSDAATESFASSKNETLNASFDQPLAFAYDGFSIRVREIGTLCQSVLTGQTAPIPANARAF
ncbi:MAG: hypothetical protein QNJ44_06430 [Rhodobacter sp.]|nr:hypothetical protein [Rhodobacter sp.]